MSANVCVRKKESVRERGVCPTVFSCVSVCCFNVAVLRQVLYFGVLHVSGQFIDLPACFVLLQGLVLVGRNGPCREYMNRNVIKHVVMNR